MYGSVVLMLWRQALLTVLGLVVFVALAAGLVVLVLRHPRAAAAIAGALVAVLVAARALFRYCIRRLTMGG